jgi:hypothetical protein
MPSKPISQREARRLRQRVAELERENRSLRGSADEILESHVIGRYNGSDGAFPGGLFRRDVKVAGYLNFRCEVKLQEDTVVLFGVRRKPWAM